MRSSCAHGHGVLGGTSLLVGFVLLVAGCQGSAGPNAGPVLRDDIVAIQQYPPTDPWLRDEEGRVVGLRTRVYFLPGAQEQEVPKGVFVAGTIRATLHAVVPLSDGGYSRQLVHEWSFDTREAEGFRIRRPSVMGESYGLILRWPTELDLAGREIQVMLSYQRKDGEIIARRGTRFRVPALLGAQYPAHLATAPARGAPDAAHTETQRHEPGNK